jgi:hypothetical protein
VFEPERCKPEPDQVPCFQGQQQERWALTFSSPTSLRGGRRA